MPLPRPRLADAHRPLSLCLNQSDSGQTHARRTLRAILDVTLDARLPLATAAIAGTATNPGTLAGVLPKLLAQISDQTANTGVLNGASF